MTRSVLVVLALAATTARATACDAELSVVPTAFVSGNVYAPLAVSVAPTTVFAPVAVEVDALSMSAVPLGVRVLAAPVQVRACVAPRARFFSRTIRPRVVVRVR